MRSCDNCGMEITSLTGHVSIKTDAWGGSVKPDLDLEFCSWKCLLEWIDKHRDEILVAQAIAKKGSS